MYQSHQQAILDVLSETINQYENNIFIMLYLMSFQFHITEICSTTPCLYEIIVYIYPIAFTVTSSSQLDTLSPHRPYT